MKTLLKVLGCRRVLFKKLRIHFLNETSENIFGQTRFKNRNNKKIPTDIVIYLPSHYSETQIYATLGHELAHALISYDHGHDRVWEKTTGFLMTFLSDIIGHPKRNTFRFARLRRVLIWLKPINIVNFFNVN